MRFLSLLAEPLHSAYRDLCRALNDQGFAIEFREFDDWREAQRALELGKTDVAAICGLLYPLIRAKGVALQPLAAPTLDSPRHSSRPEYWCDIAVRADSDIRVLSDLRGKSWLYNEKGSLSGYRIFTAALVARDHNSDFLGLETPTGSHRDSLDRLINGEGDYTTLDSTFVDFLPDATREKLRIIESLGPYPSPLLVANQHGFAFWQACRALDSLPAPLLELQKVELGDYQPIRDVWNRSLRFETGYSSEQSFVASPEGAQGRPFTSLEMCRQDQEILGDVASELSSFIGREPTQKLSDDQSFHLSARDGLMRHVYLIQPQGLAAQNLTVIGFMSRMKPDGDLAALFEADDKLIQQFSQHDGFLSYSPTECAPGVWANLAVFRDTEARDNWSANDTHLRVVRELGASSYQNIRLHLGTWPTLDQPIEWIATRYLSYEEQGLWRGVRLSDLSTDS